MPKPLSPHPYLSRPPGPVVLCIMDGIGLGAGGEDDAVARARTPNLDRLFETCAWTKLQAHGTAVGLPSDDDMGNSEVGHNAMGAGRAFDQGAKLVDQALLGPAWDTDVWRRLCGGKTLHLLGLVSDGKVHSHIDHLNALIERAASDGVRRLRVHVLTDGRDVDPRSALTWVEPLEERLASLSAGGRDYAVGSGGGRMHITMDRYQADWEMVARGWRCHVQGLGRRFDTASEAIRVLYEEEPEIDDQFLPAFVVGDGRIADGDSVLLFNFRGDRAIEISRAFEDAEFTFFDRGGRPEVFFAGMMQYDGDLRLPKNYLVSPPQITGTVSEYLAAAGIRSFACSETQKFGHVTYFFNGNRSGRVDEALETWNEIPSDTRPFEERPWMKAAEITDAVVDAIRSGRYDHVRLNYANGDMVGHTGDLLATILAVEAVDHQLGRLVAAVQSVEGVLVVTADHGNADEMYQRKGGQILRDASGKPIPRTSHTLAEVPFVVFDPRGALAVTSGGTLPAIGTTLLEILGLEPPPDYVQGLVRPVEYGM